MAFNGSGVFVRLYNWVNDAAANIKIRADRMDAEFNGIATGLSNCVTKDGQTTVTADLPMGGFKHTNVDDAAAVTDYASAGQVRDGALTILSSVSGTNTITCNAPIALTAYATGQLFSFVAGATNTSTVALNINGLGNKSVTKRGTTALDANDILNGMVCQVRYDGTRFQLLNPATTSNVTGTVAVANGGTGQTSANAAFNALAPAQANNTVLGSNGTDTSFAALAFAQVASASISTTAEIVAGTASKLISAASIAPLFYGTSVYQTAATSLPNNTWTTVAFDTESYDDGAWHDNVTNNSRVTVDFTGRVNVSCISVTAGGSGNSQGVRIRLNGAVVATDLSTESASGVCIDLAVVPTDYIEMQSLQSSGISQNTTTGLTGCRMTVRRIK